MFEMVISNCVISRVYVSPKPPHRVYLDLVDLDSPGAVFSFGADGVDFQAVMNDKSKIGRLRGNFSQYMFDGVPKWKGENIRFLPDVAGDVNNGHSDESVPALDEAVKPKK